MYGKLLARNSIPAIPIIRFLQGEEKSVSSNGTDAQHQF